MLINKFLIWYNHHIKGGGIHMSKSINLFESVTTQDRAVFITALKEFPKAAKQYTHDPSAGALNKRVAKSVINKIEVKAQRFSADEMRILYLALLLFEEKITPVEEDSSNDNIANQVQETLNKFLPPLEDFVNNLLEQ